MNRNTFMPMVVFYPNVNISGGSHDKMFDLKNSLSQTLTKYYPFAGRHTKIAPSYVDCNDDGAEFLEASIGGTLSDFFQNRHDEFDHDQFFPHGRIWCNENRRGHDHDESDNRVMPLAVQVSHFECGGVAVAVSLSHKIADGSSLIHFFNDWAKMTRFCSSKKKQDFPIDPRFIPFQHINMNYEGMPVPVFNDCITRSFMFPNSKINDLKKKVKSITNPTRVEVLTWLLYKCCVAAATKNNSGSSSKPPSIGHTTNMRNKIMEPLPENTIGNLCSYMKIVTMNEDEMKLESYIGEMKKLKMQLQGVRNIEDVYQPLVGAPLEYIVQEVKRQVEDTYICSSLCQFPTYDINFGWGKPVNTTVVGNGIKNSFLLMDAPNGDGIEAHVCLGKQDMAIVQTDPDILELMC